MRPGEPPVDGGEGDTAHGRRYETLFDVLFRLLDDLPAYVCFLAANHSVRYGNRRFRETIGQPETLPCFRLLLGRDAPCADCPPFRALHTGRPQTWEWTSPAGATYHAHAYVFRDLDGTPLVLEMGVDISERKRVEDRLRDSERRHRRLAEENAQLAQTKARLLQEVNHRVKNNLSAIIGLLYARRHHAPAAEAPTYARALEEIAANVRSMVTVHRLLSDAGWSNLSLRCVAGEVVRSAAHAMAAHGQVMVEVHGDGGVQVTPRQANNLALALNELVTNSVKYSCPRTSPLRIRVDIRRENDEVLFTYRDDGPGYPERVLRDGEHNTGLFVVKNVAAADLGGQLRLYNDGGAVVEVRFTGDGGETRQERTDPGAGG